MTRVTETDVATAILRIAAGQRNGVCTFNQARALIPGMLTLSADDLTRSKTRRREPMWHQQIRNIQSHYQSDDNFIALGYLQHVSRTGYSITPSGRNYLNNLK
jgi:hypothetical protein